MKKLTILMIVLALFITVAWGQNSMTHDSRLPRDGNNLGVQSGRYIQLYDGSILALEHLSQNTFTSVTDWTVSNDMDADSSLVTWVWKDTARSFLTQPNANMALAVRNVQSLLLTYTVNDSTTIAGGTVSAWLTGICDSLALDITAGVAKTQEITTVALADTASFVLWVRADASVTAGKFAFDDLYLTSYFESPVTIADGAEVTITIPDNAVEFIMDTLGIEVKIEVGPAYYGIFTGHPIPCSGFTTITLGNDSGSTATVYFYFKMI